MTTTLTLFAGIALGVLLVAFVGYLVARRQVARVRSALAAMHAGLPSSSPTVVRDTRNVEVGGYDDKDEDDDDELDGSPDRDAPEAVPTVKLGLPVIPTQPPRGKCADCSSFSLDAGQRILDAHPAFRAAAQWRQPWQMGERRNPKHVELERAIYDSEQIAEQTPETAREQTRLREELAKTPEYLTTDADLKRNLGVTWTDFGLCLVHKEIRASKDTCDRFTWPELDA